MIGKNEFQNQLKNFASKLPTTTSFDNVREKKKEPEVEASGFSNKKNREDSDRLKTENDGDTFCSAVLSVSDSPNSYKHFGENMTQGYVKLPRSLLGSSLWKGMRTKYQKVFQVILYHTSYKNQSFYIGANKITIEPGQFCTSIRQLVDLCNDEVRFKEDFLDKNIVERAVSLFTKVQLVRQEVRHGKSIITITHEEIYDHFKTQSETASETKPRLNRDTNEERKEDSLSFIKGTITNDTVKDDPVKKSFESPPFHPKRKIEDSDVKVIVAYCQSRSVAIQEKTIRVWLSKFSAEYITNHLLLMFESKPRSAERWMETAMKENYAQQKINVKINYEFAKEFKHRMKWKNLELKKAYCVDTETENDYPYKLDPEQFKEMLIKKFESKRRNE